VSQNETGQVLRDCSVCATDPCANRVRLVLHDLGFYLRDSRQERQEERREREEREKREERGEREEKREKKEKERQR